MDSEENKESVYQSFQPDGRSSKNEFMSLAEVEAERDQQLFVAITKPTENTADDKEQEAKVRNTELAVAKEDLKRGGLDKSLDFDENKSTG